MATPVTQQSVGTLVRAFRERAGLSQETLAERAGLGVAALASIERDQRRRPHLHTLSAVADALGLSVAEHGPPGDRPTTRPATDAGAITRARQPRARRVQSQPAQRPQPLDRPRARERRSRAAA